MSKILYSVLFGILLAITISATIKFFYQEPLYPSYPEYEKKSLNNQKLDKNMKLPSSSDFNLEEETNYFEEGKEYQEQVGNYDVALASYENNEALIRIFFAVILLFLAVLLHLRQYKYYESLLIAGIALILNIPSDTGFYSGMYQYTSTNVSSSLSIFHLAALYCCLLFVFICGVLLSRNNPTNSI